MPYAWIVFENRFKDVYLPNAARWSATISIFQSESGWDRDYSFIVRSLEGKCFVSPADRFYWANGMMREEELPVENGVQYLMKNGDRQISLIFTDYDESDMCFGKYALPTGVPISVGRGEDCVLQVSGAITQISRDQGYFMRQSDGSCFYIDNSKNGSYINGLSLTYGSVLLNFGDILALSTGIKFIYLGNCIAINRLGAFNEIRLTRLTAPSPSERKNTGKTLSVQIQHHRAPRFFQKPDDREVHIEPPIEKQSQRNQPLWLTLGPSMTMVLPMVVGSAVSASRGGSMGGGLAMVGTASALAVIWGLVNYRYRKKNEAETEEQRVARYSLYIKQAEEYLQQLNAQEYQRLLECYPNVEQCAMLPQQSAYRLWERMPQHADFLTVRLGLGTVPIPNKIVVGDVKLSTFDDVLRDEPQRLADTYGKLHNAPTTIDLRHETIVGILGTDVATSLAQGLLLQIASLHSYHDVRIVVITGEGEASRWQWVRWLPHVFASEDRQLRMVVSEQSTIDSVLAHLDEVILMRNEEAEQKGDRDEKDKELPLPHYIVFCTKPELLENKPLLRHMLSKEWGMTLVMLTESMEVLPKECRIILDASRQSGMIYYADGDAEPVEFEFPNLALSDNFSHMLAPLRVKDSIESAAIPTMVSFLDIYNVRRIEELDIWRLWNENHVYEGIKSTIGLKAGSLPFILDISDKAHGPHGLVAGTTGSGKSVMLQTYILSLAVNYHPDQVRFILIDYKGGGMAEEFRHLPHVTGIIDNLQTSNTITRALASIHGEIHRREGIFRNAGVSSIDDYIRFFYDDPQFERLPHLIIIVDEFAELKNDQPDFMQELISASRVGRSLGVHLILSTQKPSNSVSDEIWANTNFRICLRVQSRSDSMEMLHRPDAAYIKGKGRCFVQVGNDEIFEQAQTSYSGLTYNPDEPSETEMPHLLDNAGRLVMIKKARTGKTSVHEKTQMDAVMDRIDEIARAHHLEIGHSLWMEELPPAVFLKHLQKQAGLSEELWAGPNTGTELKALFGKGDDVAAQRQFPVWIDLMNNRNHMIVGMAQTGKTTMMQTLIMSFAMRYSPAACQMYVLSLSSRTLGSLSELPHIGEIVYTDEIEELHRLLRLLDNEDQRRRDVFAKASTDSFVEYNRTRALRKETTLPSIIVFVDRIAQVAEYLENDDAFTNLFYSLVREANARGIFFVVSAMKVNEVPYKIRDCFTGIGLQINDRADYVEIVGMRMPSEMPDIASFAGRALMQIDDRLFELQIALAGSSVADVERAEELGAACREMREKWDGTLPAGIPRIPEKPRYSSLLASSAYQEICADPLQFAFAYNVETGLPHRIELVNSYTYLIIGARQSGKTDLLRLIAKLWKARGAQICIAADEAWSAFCREEDLMRYDCKSAEWESYVSWLNETIRERAILRKQAQSEGAAALQALTRMFEPVVILIDDLDSFAAKNPEIANNLFAEVAKKAAKFGIYLYGTISHYAYSQSRMQEPIVSLARQQRGIALGGRLNDCDPWNVQMPYSKRGKVLPIGEAFLVENGEVTHVVIPRSE